VSTSGVPGPPSQPASGWFPNLEGLNLPRALTNGLQQGFSLIYSLRDAVNQLEATVQAMIQYGTSGQRGKVNAQAVPNGALYLETDTGKIYQSRLSSNSTTRTWILVVNGVPGP